MHYYTYFNITLNNSSGIKWFYNYIGEAGDLRLFRGIKKAIRRGGWLNDKFIKIDLISSVQAT